MLSRQLFVASSMLAGLAWSAPILETRSDYPCVEGVLVLAARGSDHEWLNASQLNPNYTHIGGMQDLGDAIAQAVGKGSYVKALPYPAVNKDYGYGVSVEIGVAAAQRIIRNYVDQCKSTVHPKIVLMGWSQGAEAMSNAIAGSREHPALSASYNQYVKAVTTFGDPTFVPNLRLDRGGAQHNGKVPRSSDAVQFLMDNYRHAIKFYCSPGDSACDSGTAPNANEIHQQEVGTWSSHAQRFIMRHV